MALKLNPGYVVAALLNLALLTGVVYFPETEIPYLWPVVIMALVLPWVLAWLIGRIVASIQKEAREKRDREDPADFV